MKRATIKIEVEGDGRVMACPMELEGEIRAIMAGLTNAIKTLKRKSQKNTAPTIELKY